MKAADNAWKARVWRESFSVERYLRERENEIFRERKIKIEFVLLYRSFSLETRCRVIILSWKYLRMDDRTTACSTTHTADTHGSCGFYEAAPMAFTTGTLRGLLVTVVAPCSHAISIQCRPPRHFHTRRDALPVFTRAAFFSQHRRLDSRPLCHAASDLGQIRPPKVFESGFSISSKFYFLELDSTNLRIDIERRFDQG